MCSLAVGCWLLANPQPGSVVVNHGSGLPSFAERIAAWCTPVFESYSSHVRYTGSTGSGQRDMAERAADADAVTGRGVSGAEGLVDLILRVNPR